MLKNDELNVNLSKSFFSLSVFVFSYSANITSITAPKNVKPKSLTYLCKIPPACASKNTSIKPKRIKSKV